MCLTIDPIYHKKRNAFGKLQPLIAENDIPVIKDLHKFFIGNDDKPHYCTPYQGMPVEFIDGVAILKAKHFKFEKPYRKHFVLWWKYIQQAISCGIHSYSRLVNFPYNHEHSHCAIIPKGTKYYVGESNDLVSLNLIVFETEEKYREYFEKQ